MFLSNLQQIKLKSVFLFNLIYPMRNNNVFHYVNIVKVVSLYIHIILFLIRIILSSVFDIIVKPVNRIYQYLGQVGL